VIGDMDLRQQNDVTLITESGYLMLVKSFTDDLVWEIFEAHNLPRFCFEIVLGYYFIVRSINTSIWLN
jgi:hypothetical protein